MRGLFSGLVFLLVFCAAAVDGGVVKKVAAEGVSSMLKPLAAESARAYKSGFEREGDLYLCDNGSDVNARRGVVWSVTLNQSEAAPIAATAQAKVVAAGGNPNADFSIYIDLQYMDGSHLWGQTAAFDPDPSSGWQKRDVTIFPDKPIRSLSINLLFRNRSGKVYFKDPRFGSFDADKLQRFDGVVVEQVKPPKKGFMLRDVAVNSDFVSIAKEALDVRINVEKRNGRGATFYDISLEDLSGKDRALTLVYIRPVKAAGLKWFHDLRYSVTLENTNHELMNTTRHEAGANGRLSRYPFGAVSAGEKGIALGLDPFTPLFFRVGCQPQTSELYLSCDIGFTPEKSTAHFRICEFDFDQEGEFRAALSRYYELYPEAFKTRIKEQGLWMPFAAISEVEGWQDFGFRFKEGTSETGWDDAHNILTFRYTEPMTWWMKFKGDQPRTLKEGEKEARRRAAAGDKAALAWLSSSFEDEKGRIPGQVRDTPWCNGVVWSMNSAPGIAGELTDFTNKWSADYIEKQYGPKRNVKCDGEYIDSAEAYVTALFDFRRSHFAGMNLPLCYSLYSRKVGIYKGMIGFEYVRALATEMHKRGHYMMANSTPISWFWLAPLLDVMGTETDWNRGGKWNPMSDEEMLYRRAMCKGKPYCFLMNTEFTEFSYECSEKYMKRSLAYGMFPGYFSSDASTGQYFTRPELYNRDRPLFKKYLPLCNLVAEAGWEPLTGAVSDNESVVVEQFGKQNGICYLTVYNLAETTQKATLKLTTLDVPSRCRELLEQKDIKWNEKQAEFELQPGDVRVLEFH
ncbi:MAG: hypothetical protein PF904_15665 [Kiritimatiellae bacterium]|jgi:hypothetical protein|nr:hypothetical protein [Kiritimatiellia bacterium]